MKTTVESGPERNVITRKLSAPIWEHLFRERKLRRRAKSKAGKAQEEELEVAWLLTRRPSIDKRVFLAWTIVLGDSASSKPRSSYLLPQRTRCNYYFRLHSFTDLVEYGN
ncbi:unnamed protein product [Toxocara canis]|uniref:Uncharacterized protein n=1 Tax=Toxocara canis TaxID=6265 RepID=A0A183V3X2_TOXCA|nr:unnamed protein product [Toxocara canis]